jgi:hypothetical protein
MSTTPGLYIGNTPFCSGNLKHPRSASKAIMTIFEFTESSALGAYAPSFALVFAAIVLLGWQALQVRLDPREPPLLKPRIPIFGHLIGLARYQTQYHYQLRYQFFIHINDVSANLGTGRRIQICRSSHYRWDLERCTSSHLRSCSSKP